MVEMVGLKAIFQKTDLEVMNLIEGMEVPHLRSLTERVRREHVELGNAENKTLLRDTKFRKFKEARKYVEQSHDLRPVHSVNHCSLIHKTGITVHRVLGGRGKVAELVLYVETAFSWPSLLCALIAVDICCFSGFSLNSYLFDGM